MTATAIWTPSRTPLIVGVRVETNYEIVLFPRFRP